jgi:hypothetical protein
LTEAVKAQAKAIFFPRIYWHCTFDVMQYKKDTLFVARAIGYLPINSAHNLCPGWVYLLEGSSETDVVAALEDLWHKLQQAIPEKAKGMSDPPLHLA